MSEQVIPKLKITICGDAEIGKTCLLISYRSNSSQSLPSIFNGIKFNKEILIGSAQHTVNINLCDTSTEQEYTQFRIKSFKDCDICLVCFDIFNLLSLQNVGTRWIPEIQQFAPNSLIVLIGLKCDLRNTGNENEISKETITEYQTKYNIIDYVETSALKKINISRAFELGIERCLVNDSENKYREYRALSATSLDGNEINDDTPSSLNSIMKTHRRQWTEHLQSMQWDNDSILRNRNDTNITFATNATTISNNSVPDQQQQGQGQQQPDLYRNNSAMSTYSTTSMPPQQQMAMYQQQQQQQQQMYYKQYGQQQPSVYRQTSAPTNMMGYQQQGMLQNVMENQQQGVVPPPPPPPSGHNIANLGPKPQLLAVVDSPEFRGGQSGTNDFNEPLLLNGNKKTASHVGSVSIDYELNGNESDDEQDEKRKKGACCIIL